MHIDPCLSPCTKLKFKWIKDLHIKPDTLKLIEEKVGKNLEHMGTGENFLNKTAMTYALRSRIDKWDLIKLQSFCKAKVIFFIRDCCEGVISFISSQPVYPLNKGRLFSNLS